MLTKLSQIDDLLNNTTFQDFKPGYKIWLEKDGLAFGDGLFELLSGVARLGSISRAASDVGMSYRAAWGKIKEAENRWNIKLVLTQVGGETGGGTILTEEGFQILTKYEIFRRQAEISIQELFNELFKR